MTLHEFAVHIHDHYPNLKVCYIAIISVEGQYDLEIEVSANSIGGMYRTNLNDLSSVRRLATWLEKRLVALGIRVCASRVEWDNK
jgi:hypothetical protein